MSGKDLDSESREESEVVLLKRRILASEEVDIERMPLGNRALGDPSSATQVREQSIHQALKYLILRQRLENPSITSEGTERSLASIQEIAGLLPVRVYLPKEDRTTEDQILEAIDLLSEALEMEVVLNFREVRRSWFKTWIMKMRRVVSVPEVAERLQKLEKALELKVLELPRAQVDEKQAHAVAELLRSLTRTPEAFVQIGALVIVKHPSVNGGIVCVRTLSPSIMHRIESDPNLLSSPTDFLKILEHLPKLEQQRNETNSTVTAIAQRAKSPTGAKRPAKKRNRNRPAAVPPTPPQKTRQVTHATVTTNGQETDCASADKDSRQEAPLLEPEQKGKPAEVQKL